MTCVSSVLLVVSHDGSGRYSLGFIISQSKVLKLLQKLQNSTEKVTEFDNESGRHLEILLDKHLEERVTDAEDFELRFLWKEGECEGLAILYSGCSEIVTVWGFDSQSTSQYNINFS